MINMEYSKTTFGKVRHMVDDKGNTLCHKTDTYITLSAHNLPLCKKCEGEYQFILGDIFCGC